MSAEAFEKNNWGWQWQQWQQQAGEWIELQFSQMQPNVPHVPGVALPEWLGELLWRLVQGTFWLTLVVLVTWLGWQVWQLWGHSVTAFPSLWRNLAEKTQAVPVREVSLSEWLRRSQEFQRQGNYQEACRCLYMAMLQRLNDTGIAPHQPSRTDGEYQEVVQYLEPNQPYELLLATHKRLCFGNAEITPEIFAQCWDAYGAINLEESSLK